MSARQGRLRDPASRASGRRRPRRRRPLDERGPAVGAVVLIVALALGAGWPWALLVAVAAGVGLAAYAVAVRHLGRRDRSRRPAADLAGGERLAYPPGWTPDRVREVLGEASVAITQTRAAAGGVVDAVVRAKALAWCDGVDRLIADLRRRPTDVARARRFLAYYPAAAQAIVAGHARLERQVPGASSATPDTTATGATPDAGPSGTATVTPAAHTSAEERYRALLDRVGPAFDDLGAALREQADALLRDGALELDVELSLLSRTVRFEGPSGDEARSRRPGGGRAALEPGRG